jgi:DNA-binding response OmpR family regulator
LHSFHDGMKMDSSWFMSAARACNVRRNWIESRTFSMNILLAEDEKRMAELLRKGLEEEGHSVVCVADGMEALEASRRCDFEMIILDVMMPRLDGYEVARKLRADRISSAILMLTAKDSVQDIVRGLDLGADDYLTKPFSFNELLARLRAVRRRVRTLQTTSVQVDDLVLDPVTRDVSRAGTRIVLTRTEYRLLERLILDRGQVVLRRELIEAIWGPSQEIEENTLDAFVRLLRTKVDGDGRRKLIHTHRGVGYMVSEEPR